MRIKLQITVMFSVKFEKRWSRQMSSSGNEAWIQSDCVGNDVEFIFNINGIIGKCGVIVHVLPPEVHWTF